MPHRRRTTLVVALAAVTAMGATACDGIEIDIPGGTLPAPVSIAPIPSASAGLPAYVCTAVHKILTEGAVRIAEQTLDNNTDGVRRTFVDMAGQVTAAGAGATDPAQRAAVTEIAASLTAAAGQPDPRTYLNGDFATVGRKLDGTCTPR